MSLFERGEDKDDVAIPLLAIISGLAIIYAIAKELLGDGDE